MPQGQPPKRTLLLSSPWLWLPSSCKILSNRRNMTSHASSTDVPTTSPPSLLLFQISSSTLPMQASRVSSGVQLTLNYAAQEFLLINHMVKKIIIITEAYIIQMTGHGFNVLFPFWPMRPLRIGPTFVAIILLIWCYRVSCDCLAEKSLSCLSSHPEWASRPKTLNAFEVRAHVAIHLPCQLGLPCPLPGPTGSLQMALSL